MIPALTAINKQIYRSLSDSDMQNAKKKKKKNRNPQTVFKPTVSASEQEKKSREF
jgi:hypothetical protein